MGALPAGGITKILKTLKNIFYNILFTSYGFLCIHFLVVGPLTNRLGLFKNISGI